MRWALGLVSLLGCESTTFVDCPTFDRESCVDTDACRYRLFGDGSGECRNTCDPMVEEPCPDGLECVVTEYWDPATNDNPGPVEDLCIEE